MNIGRHQYCVLAWRREDLLLLPGWAPHLRLGPQEIQDHVSFREVDLPLALRYAVTAVRLGAGPSRPISPTAWKASLESHLARFLPGEPCPPPWVHEAVRLVFEHSTEPWSMPRIAAEVGVSAAHLTTQVRRWTGRSLVQWSITARLDYADLALRDPARTVAEVAQEAGFSDLAHFRRLFRRRFQQTPQEHR